MGKSIESLKRNGLYSDRVAGGTAIKSLGVDADRMDTLTESHGQVIAIVHGMATVWLSMAAVWLPYGCCMTDVWLLRGHARRSFYIQR